MRNGIDSYVCTVIRFWQDFLDSLNTDGGHIILLIVLIEIFLGHNAEAYLDLAIGALLMKLKDAGSSKARRDRPVHEMVQTTEVVEVKKPEDK